MDKIHLSISSSEIRDAKRLCFKVLLFVPVLLMVAVVNIRLDPAGLYKKLVNKSQGAEYHAVQALAEGQESQRLPLSIDDRLLEKYLIARMTSSPDIVILGSSHSMWLGENIFPGHKVINNSVIHVTLADYLGIFEGYVKKNYYPKRVVLLLDPQLVAFPFISERWLSIKDDTYGMLEGLGVRSVKFNQPMVPRAWLNIFSFSYFQKSIEILPRKHTQRNHPMNIDINDGQISLLDDDGQVLMKDGRRLWTMDLLSWSAEKSRRRTLRELQEGTFIQEFSQKKTNKELENILEDFIRYLTGHHIQVTLCMLPLHPQLYKSFLDQQKKQRVLNIVEVQQYYHALAEKLNLDMVGSYDPADCNLDGRDFYDADHIRNDVLEKILKQKSSPCYMPGAK